ncbi:MAG: hypothetical protein ACM34O_12830 [Ignavibacteria bacterium]
MKKSYGKYVFIILLILLIAGEIAYHFFPSDSDTYFLQDKETGAVTFNTTRLKNIYKKYSDIPYNYFNQFKSQKSPGALRIFLIGEASLAGWPYSTTHSIGKLIETKVEKFAAGKNFEVITISFAGFNSFHAAEIIPQTLRFQPDLIILYLGHNEFYGYKGSSAFGLSKLLTFNMLENLLLNIGVRKSFKYDTKTDDFELLQPLSSDEKFIYNFGNEYDNTLKNFNENIFRIAELCCKHKVELIFTDPADNILQPPLGIYSISNQPGADIIYNSARMALHRDGNENEAEKLFRQSTELDAFRLRVPFGFSSDLRKIAENSSLTIADVKGAFSRFSPNHIPGDDLFADYIHPNLAGLDIIAAEYSRLILDKILKDSANTEIEDLLNKQETTNTAHLENDFLLEKKRIEKASITLRRANLTQKTAPASVK